MLRKENGVTLVALVITIIVLLILAGVTLAMVMGENGLFGKADKAKADTEYANAKEAVLRAVMEINADQADGTKAGYDDLTEAVKDINNILTSYQSGYTVANSSGTLSVSKSGNAVTNYAGTALTFTISKTSGGTLIVQ